MVPGRRSGPAQRQSARPWRGRWPGHAEYPSSSPREPWQDASWIGSPLSRQCKLRATWTPAYVAAVLSGWSTCVRYPPCAAQSLPSPLGRWPDHGGLLTVLQRCHRREISSLRSMLLLPATPETLVLPEPAGDAGGSAQPGATLRLAAVDARRSRLLAKPQSSCDLSQPQPRGAVSPWPAPADVYARGRAPVKLGALCPRSGRGGQIGLTST